MKRKRNNLFGPDAVAKAKRVTKIRRVRHRDTGQLGEITGSAPSGWVKVKWDNRDKSTLIKRSEITLVRQMARGKRNPEETENQKAWRKGYEHGYKGLNSRPDYPKVGLAGSYRLGYEAGERRRKGKAQPRKNPGVYRIETLNTKDSGARWNFVTDKDGKTSEFVTYAAALRVARKIRKHSKQYEIRIFPYRGAGTVKEFKAIKNPKREAKTSKDAFGVTHENPESEEQKLRKAIKTLAEFKRLYGNDIKFYTDQIAYIKALRESIAARKRTKKNPSVAAIAEKFQGKTDGAIEEFHASFSAPANLARAGKLVFLKVGAKTFRLPTAMVAIAPNEKLWIVSKRAPVFSTKAKPGEGLDVGEITQICYETAKQHIGDGKRFEYVHEFGEDGGKRPHLIIDHEGMPILRGGDYKIKAEGIVN